MSRETKIRTILNNVYQDANGVPNFNATLANGTVDIALREIMVLFPQPLDEGKVIKICNEIADKYNTSGKIYISGVNFKDLASAICTTFGKVEGVVIDKEKIKPLICGLVSRIISYAFIYDNADNDIEKTEINKKISFDVDKTIEAIANKSAELIKESR